MFTTYEVETTFDPKFVGALAELQYCMSLLLDHLAVATREETERVLGGLRRLFNLRAQEPTSAERAEAERAFTQAVADVVGGFQWTIPDSEVLVEHAADVLKGALLDRCGRCLMSYVAVETETGMALDFESRTVMRGVPQGKRKLPVVTDEERHPGLWRCNDCGRFLGGFAK
jgi:hypothetical protein